MEKHHRVYYSTAINNALDIITSKVSEKVSSASHSNMEVSEIWVELIQGMYNLNTAMTEIPITNYNKCSISIEEQILQCTARIDYG